LKFKVFKIALTVVLSLLCPLVSKAQQTVVGGTVTDSAGEPLTGAFVYVKGSTQGCSTDFDGRYSLSVNQGDIIVISFIGFKDKEVEWDGKDVLDVVLADRMNLLDDVVVIGYGTVKKKDLTGSVGNVGATNLEKNVVPDLGGALQGQVAGLQVITTGKPGDNVSLNIRGVGSINGSSPLVVIDGVPSSINLNSLNMADVESVDVLKDASACAIYGSRGAYGVVLITTKKGKRGEGRVDLRATYSVQQIARRLKLLNASQFASLHNEMMAGAALDQYEAYADPTLWGTGTDWQDELFQLGTMQEYGVTWSGGSETSRNYASLSFMDQRGVIGNTRFLRFNAQFNGESDVKSWLKFGHNITLNNDVKNQGGYDIEGTLAALPNNPIRNADGSWAGPSGNSMYVGEVINPIGRNELNTQKTVGYNMLGSVYAEIKPWDFLSLKSTAAIQAMIWNQDNWTQEYPWEPVPVEESTRFQYHNNAIEWMWDNILTFDKTFSSKHHINAIAGLSVTENSYKHFGGSVSSFISDSAREMGNGILDPLVYGSRSDWALVSVITRVNYTYDDRYYATATWRLDGSSRFNRNNRWGNFPSLSLAWKLSNEKFFPRNGVVSEMKLRAGYGMTGNQTNVGAYGYANTLSAVQYVFNDMQAGGFAPVVLSNPDITWEKVEQFNAGLNLDLFKGRISLSADVYEKNTRDMLVPMSVPISSGYSDENVPQINAGSMRNVGTEWALTTRNISTVDWDWSTTLIAAWNKGWITALNGDVPIYGGSLGLNESTTINAVGHPAGSFYGYVTDGIFQTQGEVDYAALQVEGGTAPGDIRFKDLNGDGVIDADDRTYLGNPTPAWQFSLNNTLRWKGLELSIFLQGVADCEIFNVTRMNLEAMSVAENQSAMTLARWRGEGTTDSMPRAVYGDPNGNARASDRFIEDGSYLRLKNVQLAWSMPQDMAGKLRLSSFKVFLSGQNLLTLTRYSGMDPEVGASGLDNNIYPQIRTFTAGVNLTF